MNPKIPEIFKLEDFDSPIVAIKAQQIFEAWLERNSKVVYGLEESRDDYILWSDKHDLIDTHVAYLIAPTEIKKECEHRISLEFPTMISKGNIFQCKDCNKKLTPIWQGVE